MDKNLVDIIANWLNEEVAGSSELKSIKTSIEGEERVIYASIEFVIVGPSGAKRTIKEESRISLNGISEDALRNELNNIIERINL